jgi:hypothetical protein
MKRWGCHGQEGVVETTKEGIRTDILDRVETHWMGGEFRPDASASL